MGLPVVALYLYLIWSGGAIGKSVFDWWFAVKLMSPLLFMNGYSLPLSMALAVTITVLLVFLGYNGVLGLTRPAIFIGSGFLIAYLVIPTRLFESAYTEIRLITAMMLILPAFLTVNWRSGAVRSAAALVAVSVILTNAATVASVWFAYRSDYAEMISSFRLLRANSTLLVARGDGTGGGIDAPMFYAPVLAVHYASVFAPALYALPGLHPVRAVPSKSRFAIEDSLDFLPTKISQLNSALASKRAPAHVRGWRSDYDYLYIVGHETGSIPDHLTRMVQGRRFTLYAIAK